MSFNPFDLTGGPFLQLYGGLFVVTILLGILIPRWLRPEGQERLLKDRDALAYLAGGKGRLAEAVVAGLLSRGALTIDSGRFALSGRETAQTPSERGVLALAAPASWGQVVRAATADVEPIEDRLVRDELLISHSEAVQLRLFQTLPYLLLFAFGAIKWQVGVLRDKPVGFLTAFLIVTGVFALIRFAALDRRTPAAKAVLRDAQERSERLKRAPTTEESAMAVALFGTVVLAGSGMDDFHQLRARDGGSGGDSGGSSGDGGGSSGGGGGCGGCGGGS